MGLRQTLNVKNNSVLVDDTSEANIVYVGVAPVGSEKDQPVWQIKKIDLTSGASIYFANARPSYENIWDNRLSLNYL